MNDYLAQIRNGEPVIITGRIPKLGAIILVTLASVVATVLMAWVLYQKLPITAWAAMLGLLHLPQLWLSGLRNRRFQAIHLGPDGLYTRGVLAPWASVARIDANPITPSCLVHLHPGSTVKFAQTPQELQLRFEVTRDHGIPLEIRHHTLLPSQVADLCTAAKVRYQ